MSVRRCRRDEGQGVRRYDVCLDTETGGRTRDRFRRRFRPGRA
ncbi:hypothetical protein QQY66_26850 [Streptomyces sp. DG2A-72]|nr:hypothetical protein [Streptomyces sp. DG2A-72]MDO0935110.1 hypothetical protein [Streptomyces sp. DG2A-72]